MAVNDLYASQKVGQEDEGGLRKATYLRLDDDSTDTMILPDGRTLCFAQYGEPSGEAVIYIHGYVS